jgi:hypothetical protein
MVLGRRIVSQDGRTARPERSPIAGRRRSVLSTGCLDTEKGVQLDRQVLIPEADEGTPWYVASLFLLARRFQAGSAEPRSQ